jgi:hypothetical protein
MNRIHVITLGVKDIDKSLAFYWDGLGFRTTVSEDNPPIVFFQSMGVALALCSLEGLSEDINHDYPPAGSGFSGTTLGMLWKKRMKSKRYSHLTKKQEARS